MSSNSSKLKHTKQHWLKVLAVSAWVLGSFVIASFVVLGVHLFVSRIVGAQLFSSTVTQTIATIATYGLAILMVLGIPYWWRRVSTSREELGLKSWVTMTDLLLAPAGLVVYLLLSGILGAIAGVVVPWYDPNIAQETGFQGISQYYEYALAFVCLVILAPVAEEVLFRGYLFGKLLKYVPVWAAMLVTSILFGIAHASWAVGVDVFALSIILCSLRLITGNIWASVVLHMIKNGIAFYILFVNPLGMPI